MDYSTPSVGAKGMLDPEGLQALIATLAARGYQVLGPTRARRRDRL